ncbi:MAG: tetratricopeptide repeat protein [Burkholderiales bacterium]
MSGERRQGLVARGVALHQAGRLDEAEALYRQVLRMEPRHATALTMLGTLHAQRRNPAEAERLFGMSLEVDPFQVGALYNRGIVLTELKRFEEALESYDRANALKPDDPVILNNRGIALAELKRFDEALESYDRALTLNREYPDAYFNRGMVLSGLGRHEEALASYDRALATTPHDARALFNRANVLAELGRHREAIESYDRAITLVPDDPIAFNNRGNVLADLCRYKDALECYERAIALKPDYLEALFNRGVALSELKRFEEALASFERAVGFRPDFPYAFPYALSSIFRAPQNLCDWYSYEETTDSIVGKVRAGKRAATPFHFLSLSDSAADQLQCSRIFAADKYPAASQPLWRGERYRHDRIRLAYLSADFRAHATSFLLAGMFEHHDRSRFETIAVSFGADDQSEMQTRLEGALEHFVDVRNRSDAEVARLMRELEVEIAVDLMGYTQSARMGILALRPAPVQVNYLGYPGTLGSDHIDYILADRVVIPEDLHVHYAEKVVYLPDTFQANDSKRPIADYTPSRGEAGLPDKGFVFCSFNNTYKINPRVFDVWMRLLDQVQGSVLWLLKDSDTVALNLRREAKSRGVEPGRLVFAKRVKVQDYLARYRLADLFLDTLPFNAGTTASDALWAGLPLVTCAGAAFAARMAGSLLHAVGLPELVTQSLEEYEALAIALVREPERLRRIRDKLARNRLSYPLFDTARFTRHLEAAYEEMHRLHKQGECPRTFSVTPLESQASHAADDR